MYLLDANVLITANNLYYPIDRVPEFWDWLAHMGSTNAAKMPPEIMQEINSGNDDLAAWISQRATIDALRLDEEPNPAQVQAVLDQYATDLNDAELIQIGNDPFLMAHALSAPDQRTVVTVEVSKPSCQRANRRIPDVCSDLDVNCCDTFQMLRALDFSTGWSA